MQEPFTAGLLGYFQSMRGCLDVDSFHRQKGYEIDGTTVATYKMYLQRFLRPKWDGHIATKISHHAIQNWLQELKRDHSLANRTVNHLKGLMALVYRVGARRELIPNSCNPARKVKCVTTSEYEPKVISPEEAHSVWSRLKQPDSTLVLLVAVTGLRISEALALK